MQFAFYVSAAVAILATLMVVTRFEAVHALLYLVVSLLAVATAFYTLGAPFAAALEVIIYAGAIVVLFVFVVMMLNLGGEASAAERGLLSGAMWIGPSLLSLVLLVEVLHLIVHGAGAPRAVAEVPAREVGLALFGPYLVAVELGSMLLLAGLVGAYHFGRRADVDEEER